MMLLPGAESREPFAPGYRRLPPRGTDGSRLPAPFLSHITRSTSAPRNTVMLMIPFIVKNAALSFDRSPGFTS